jgi:hypothetical protein
MKTSSFKGLIVGCLTAVFLIQVSHAQVIDDGTGSASNYNTSGWRNNDGAVKFGEIITPTPLTNLGIGHWMLNNHGSNIGQNRQINIQAEYGNIAHLLKVGSSGNAFGTTNDDIWSTIGINLNGNTDFYGMRGQWNKYGAWVGLQSTDPSSFTLLPNYSSNNNVLDVKNALVAWSKTPEAPDNRLKFSQFSGSSESEKMTILTNGNVGMGTSAPLFPLQVNALVNGWGFDVNPALDNPIIADFHNARVPGQLVDMMGAYHAAITVSNNYGKGQVALDDAGNVYMGSRLRQNGGAGKVFITTNDNQPMVEIHNGGLNSYRDLTIGSASGHRWMFHQQWWTGAPEFLTLVPEDLTHPDGWNWNRGLTMHRTGEFSVTVEGKFGAREIEVKLGQWNDDVFNCDYALKPLSEVEEFVKINRHLPEIPSEKEIVDEGLNVGSMLSLQMKKIEELYLYMIDLEKKYNDLEVQNQQLQIQNQELMQLMEEGQK